TTTNLFYEKIEIGNLYITYTSIIGAVLLIVLLILKNNNKASLVLNITRIDKERLITILVFNFYYISMIIAFLASNQISFFVSLFLISCELLVIILSLLISFKNISYSIDKLLLKIRDILFFVLVLDLILNNVPFGAYSIPLDQLLIASYSGLIGFIVYKLFIALKPEL
ncbi:MAG: hypothetical protein ACRC5R_01130, partial [Mycoplasmatales bacterium]